MVSFYGNWDGDIVVIIVACGIQHFPLYCEVLPPFISILYIVCISQNKLTQSTREVTDPTNFRFYFFQEKWNEFRSTQSQYKSKSFEVKKIKVYLVFFPPHRTANRSPFMGPLKETITQTLAIKLASKYVYRLKCTTKISVS